LELRPDIKFKKELELISGAPLNTCMQCGTCSVVCNLSPDENPFPRKEMVYAGWGLSEKMIANPDVWLCHQCGDCSTHCPRGVNPADVMAATRQLTYQRYANPKFMGQLLGKPGMLPLAILIPVVIIAFIIYMAGTLHIPEGPVDYSHFFPHAWLNVSFSALTLASYLLASFGFGRFWKEMNLQHSRNEPKKSIFRSFWGVKNDILAHNRFNKCEETKSRKVSHFLVFYGFILLLLVTVYAIYAAITEQYPLPLSNPFKMLGNLSSLMLFSGLGIMIYKRIAKKTGSERSTYSDWLLLGSMVLLTASGTLVEMARFLDWSLAYHLYFFHLVCVWFVIIYLPYTKFGHIIYRTIAMTYAFSVNRK
jgi:quinone-modifying oxidoreductase, subunit QmoC